ncbi:MAG: ATP phosphoribosyltransferase regulatory subunit [Clostridiales bacterium]|nr:ATP phosphoribosyltransferase regulatory subunit [Clostridiales bacterium]
MAGSRKQTPDGMGDRLFAGMAAERRVLRELEAVFEAAGYRQVRTPGLEYLSVFESKAAYFPEEELYKLADAGGRLLAVRPDNTIPVVRLAATKLQGGGLPLKLYYEQNVFRRQPEHRGRHTETMQAGVECIGEAGFASDVEIIELAARSLAASYAGQFRIEIGHVGLYKELVRRLGLDEAARERIHSYVTSKNYAALEEALDDAADREAGALLLKLPGLFGAGEALDEAQALFAGAGEEIGQMLRYLKQVTSELSARGFGDQVMLDLGLVNQAEYYSSLVFRGYGESAGEPLLSGGRYDTLFRDFGEDLPATGFGINVDLLTEAALRAEEQGAGPAGSGEGDAGTRAEAKPLRVALTKGRLEKDFSDLMERAGYDVSPLREKGRRLLMPIPGAGIEIFLAKAPDVVTYVEHGVCDIGIVGKDTMLEQGGTYYEIMDLGIGGCRFALAAPKGSRVLCGEAPTSVATKYPEFAARHFERLGLDVRIIRIDGSVEIAPLLGLADAIVDIVETGTTLKENGLEVAGTIREISARLIVNVTGMKLRKAEIEAFAARLKAAGENG